MVVLTRRRSARYAAAARVIQRYGRRWISNNRYSIASAAGQYAGQLARQHGSRLMRIARNRFFGTRRNDVSNAFSGNDIRISYGRRLVLRSTKKIAKAQRRAVKRSVKRGGGNKLANMIYKNLCTPQTIKWTYANSFNGSQGQRNYVSIFLGGESLLQYLGTKRPSNFLFDVTPSAGTGGSTLQDIGQKNWQLHVDKLMYDFRVQNRSNASMELKVYECLARRDFPLGVDTNLMFSDFVTSTDPVTAVGSVGNLGPQQDALTTGVSHSLALPTSTPYDSNEFTTSFKIIAQNSVKLGPNEIIPMKTYLKSKSFKASWIYSEQSKEYQRNWSKILLFSWVGQPVDDGTSSKNTKSQNDLVIHYDGYIKFHFMPGQSRLVNYVLNTPASTDGGTKQYGPPFYGYANDDVTGGDNQYYANPSGFTPVIPATETVQTVPGQTTVGDTVPESDLT